jgi:hypothetical protein
VSRLVHNGSRLVVDKVTRQQAGPERKTDTGWSAGLVKVSRLVQKGRLKQAGP